MKRDPRVDDYIARSAESLRPLLERLRDMAHGALPEAEEAIKWNVPHFTVRGKNVAGMSAFKAHCAFGIHGDAMSRRFIRVTCEADLPTEAELAMLLREAADRILDGGRPAKAPAVRKPRPEIPMPREFADALAAVPEAQAAFEHFAPSHRRDYLEWITEAKTAVTRDKRMAQAVAWIAEGKTRNWKYERPRRSS
ncbi:YdeI family protein [Novosphingobium sp. ZW T3_23]|uniref:YdeI/OmpD-associated family protein n=1 Tax=Novosphingobium sp. ZW T3_23 TaxID=3378084 RepID=UPI0038555E8F